MASLFSKADLAIGAGKEDVVWDYQHFIDYVDNQVPAASAMKGSGAIVYSGDIRHNIGNIN